MSFKQLQQFEISWTTTDWSFNDISKCLYIFRLSFRSFFNRYCNFFNGFQHIIDVYSFAYSHDLKRATEDLILNVKIVTLLIISIFKNVKVTPTIYGHLISFYMYCQDWVFSLREGEHFNCQDTKYINIRLGSPKLTNVFFWKAALDYSLEHL